MIEHEDAKEPQMDDKKANQLSAVRKQFREMETEAEAALQGDSAGGEHNG